MKTSRLFTLLTAAALLTLAACTTTDTATPDAAVQPVALNQFAVIAEGRVVPVNYVDLAFSASGRIAEVFLAEGDTVTADQVIARLEDSQQLAAQRSANELERLAAEQALADLTDETPYILAAAQAQQDLATANDQLDDAQRRLRNLYNPDIEFYEDEIEDARESLLTVEENIDLTEINLATFALDQAQENFDDFERYYNGVRAAIDNCDTSNADLNCDPNRRVVIEGIPWTLEDVTEARNDAANRLTEARIRLAQAQRGNENALDDAQERIEDAEEDLAFALADPKNLDVALAEAEVARWEAAVRDATERLADAQAGPDPADVALVEARITAAQSALQATDDALSRLELRAPFAGTLARIDLKTGEQVAAGIPVVILADFTTWVVETDNLTEIEVVRVEPGQTVTIALDALPDAEFTGTVRTIESIFEEKRGDITYTVTIDLTATDPRIRWGMTAVTTFDN